MCPVEQTSPTETIKFDLVVTGASALVTIAGLDTRTAKTLSATAKISSAMAETLNASAVLTAIKLKTRKLQSAKRSDARRLPRAGGSVLHATGRGSKTAAKSR